MSGIILFQQHRYNQEIKAQLDAKFESVEAEIKGINNAYSSLNVKIDSIQAQNNIIDSLQRESYEINKQAKERADDAILSYRNYVLSLPDL